MDVTFKPCDEIWNGIRNGADLMPFARSMTWSHIICGDVDIFCFHEQRLRIFLLLQASCCFFLLYLHRSKEVHHHMFVDLPDRFRTFCQTITGNAPTLVFGESLEFPAVVILALIGKNLPVYTGGNPKEVFLHFTDFFDVLTWCIAAVMNGGDHNPLRTSPFQAAYCLIFVPVDDTRQGKTVLDQLHAAVIPNLFRYLATSKP